MIKTSYLLNDWLPVYHKRIKRRLANWGRWAGGSIADPALVHYYTKQPWVPEEWNPRPAIDEMDARRTEKILLKLRKEGKRGAYFFRLLRSKYAYGKTVRELSESRGIDLQKTYLHLYEGEYEFWRCWQEAYYGLQPGDQGELDL